MVAAQSYSQPLRTQYFRSPAQEAQQQRIDQLKNSCDLLSAGFEKLDSLLEGYIRAVPLSTRDTERSDAERFLRWITTVTNIQPEQQDLITCLESRYAVEFITFKRRLAYHRFLEMVYHSQQRFGQSGFLARASLHMNPLHVWATFETQVLLGANSIVPATVLFYPNTSGIQVSVLSKDSLFILQHLDNGKYPVKKLLKGRSKDQQAMMISLINEMTEMGIIALA